MLYLFNVSFTGTSNTSGLFISQILSGIDMQFLYITSLLQEDSNTEKNKRKDINLWFTVEIKVQN